MSDPKIVESGIKQPVHYKERFCPILSLVSLNVPETRLHGADGAGPKGPSLSACRGMTCMFFRPQLVPSAVGEKETLDLVNGVCAISEIAHNTGAQAALTAEMFNRSVNLPRKK